jgi:hypothetical protein
MRKMEIRTPAARTIARKTREYAGEQDTASISAIYVTLLAKFSE